MRVFFRERHEMHEQTQSVTPRPPYFFDVRIPEKAFLPG